MEEVEKANSLAVESCHRVINLLSQPRDENRHRNFVRQTGESVNRFKKVVSLLTSSTTGHARVRKSKTFQAPFPTNLFMESPILTNAGDNLLKPLQLLDRIPIQETGYNANKNALTLGKPCLELSSNGQNQLRLSQQAPLLPNYHFLQQQRLKQQAEVMYRRSNSGVSLNFDSSACTPSMSSARSFISSLSIDGSVANLGGSSFNLMGGTHSADQSSCQHKRKCSRGDDGSVKCGGSSSRCHCSKKR